MPAPGAKPPSDHPAGDTADHKAGALRAVQIASILRFTPIAFAVNTGNAVLLGFVVAPFADPLVLGAWIVSLVALTGLNFLAWAESRRGPPRREASERSIRHATIHAGALGAIWAIAPVLWFPEAPVSAQLVIGIAVTGMICAGGFALATISSAAIVYILVLTTGALIGLALSTTPYTPVLCPLLLVYAFVMCHSARMAGELFERQFMSELNLREHGELIGLLLAEFEEGASDWLFELDAAGAIVKHSPRFADVAGKPGSSLEGIGLGTLLAPGSAGQLAGVMRAGQPFRDFVVEVTGAAMPRWWSLTAKPIAGDENGAVLWRGVGADITVAKSASDQAAYLARTDELSGLLNRTAYMSAAREAIRVAAEQKQELALVTLDLDGFKHINDNLGQPVGDKLIQQVAATLRRHGPEGATLGRSGGDEFGLIIPCPAGRDEIIAAMQALVDEVGTSRDIDGRRVTISTSLGVAFFPADGDDLDRLSRNVDLALYAAKALSGNSFVVYDGDLQQAEEAKRVFEQELAQAAARNQFHLVYQPILDIATGRTCGFEALLRWRHPEYGAVSPMDFVPVAERTGLVVPIGTWVLKEACREAARWPSGISVSVNLSPVQLCEPDFLDIIRTTLAETGLKPGRLELEITETMFMSHGEEQLRVLQDVRAMGISVSLDDFGTGYSSLGYLNRFAIDKIKIDKSFVTGVTSIAQRTAIIRAVIGIARSLGMLTTAEGVEDEATLAWLRVNGCCLAQGYLFAKPMPREEVGVFLDREALNNAPPVARGMAS